GPGTRPRGPDLPLSQGPGTTSPRRTALPRAAALARPSAAGLAPAPVLAAHGSLLHPVGRTLHSLPPLTAPQHHGCSRNRTIPDQPGGQPPCLGQYPKPGFLRLAVPVSAGAGDRVAPAGRPPGPPPETPAHGPLPRRSAPVPGCGGGWGRA